jgi:hypothetical protein
MEQKGVAMSTDTALARICFHTVIRTVISARIPPLMVNLRASTKESRNFTEQTIETGIPLA